jgi:DNA-binding PadR family transcriptional regulator
MKTHHDHPRGRHGHGRRRARRGAVSASILVLLEEQPMHGYELIGALEERSGGRWRPSPGAIYPALAKLEQRGLLTSSEVEGKRRYELTDLGRERVAEMRDADDTEPWEASSRGRHDELRRAIAELVGPAKQLGRFGSPDQIAKAQEVLRRATSELYRILADGPEQLDEELGDEADSDDD